MEETGGSQRKRNSSNAMQVSAAKAASKKVTNTVATFLNKDSDGFQLPTTKVELEKVTNMVGTFLTDDSIGCQFGYSYQQIVSECVKGRATKTELEKVTNMVGTFLNEGSAKGYIVTLATSYHQY